MLSCLAPPRFGQEDKIIMPSSTAFSLQFPSLASSLHHHNNNKDDNNMTTAAAAAAVHADYFIKCPQCHQRLPGFQALRDHFEIEHPSTVGDKFLPFDTSSLPLNYHNNNNNSSAHRHHHDSFSNSSNSNSSMHNSQQIQQHYNNNSSSHHNTGRNSSMIPGTPSPPISGAAAIGGIGQAATDLSVSTNSALVSQLSQQHHHHHHHLQRQQQMAMALAAGMQRNSPPTSSSAASINGYDEGGRSTGSPSSSTFGDICGALNGAAASMLSSGPGGPYGCVQCSAAFPTRDLLEKHEILHSPNSTVCCKICRKTFANVYRLQRHMISHDESALLRKFKCTQCDKAFKFKHHLKEHVRIHSGEKPFGCDNCGKRFSHSGSYSSHMTSKKCISMSLKLNPNRAMMKLTSPTSKKLAAVAAAGLVPNPMSYFPAGLPNVSLPGPINNNNSANSPNNNAFYPMLPKYNNYDAMNAALFASLQHPFYNMAAAALDPRIHPFSIHQLLTQNILKSNEEENNCRTGDGGNKTPNSLNSDPEDMIEEVTEDVTDEPKLVMDLDDEKGHETRQRNLEITVTSTHSNYEDDEEDDEENDIQDKKPNGIIENSNQENYIERKYSIKTENEQISSKSSIAAINLVTENDKDDYERKIIEESNEQQNEDEGIIDEMDEREDDEEEKSNEDFRPALQCGRCDKKFNHHTELVQHEKVLCGMLQEQPEKLERIQSIENDPPNNLYFQQSASDEDAEDRESKTGSECERKVRVRTAITEEQQSVLKEHYAINSRPSREEFRMIANRLGLDARVVQVWFQNNRSRERKLNSFNNLINQKQSASANLNFNTPPTLRQSTISSSSPIPFNPSSPTSVRVVSQQQPLKAISSEEQPLDLSVKKEQTSIRKLAVSSPQYGTAPQQNDYAEAINLSRKASSLSPPQFRPFYGGAVPPLLRPSSPTSNDTVPLRQQQQQQQQKQQPPTQSSQTNPYFMPSGRGLVPMECLLQMAPEYARNQLLGFKLGTNTDCGTSLSPRSEKRKRRDDESRISHDDEFSMIRSEGKRLKMDGVGVTNTTSNGTGEELPFVCDQCDKAFSKQSSLARHKYEHSGQRPYKCIECPKAFKHKHHLTEHKRLHSGEKPFQCCKCLKRFSHSGSYSQHMNHRYSYCKPYRE